MAIFGELHGFAKNLDIVDLLPLTDCVEEEVPANQNGQADKQVQSNDYDEGAALRVAPMSQQSRQHIWQIRHGCLRTTTSTSRR